MSGDHRVASPGGAKSYLGMLDQDRTYGEFLIEAANMLVGPTRRGLVPPADSRLSNWGV